MKIRYKIAEFNPNVLKAGDWVIPSESLVKHTRGFNITQYASEEFKGISYLISTIASDGIYIQIDGKTYKGHLYHREDLVKIKPGLPQYSYVF